MAKNTSRSHLDLKNIPIIAIVTYIITLSAWIAIVGRFFPMSSTTNNLQMTDPGAPEAIAISNGISGILLYLIMWGIMMVAMMYPSSVPLFQMYYNTIQGTTKIGKTTRIFTFMATYAVVWTLTGIFPLALNSLIPITYIANENSFLLLGGTLVLLSVYQLSSYKNQCLKYCRSPLGFLMEYRSSGVSGAANMSLRFSIFCIGCCWALFIVMIVIGSMNILWMAIITIVLSLERLVSWGDFFAKVIGIIAGIGGSGLILLSVL